MCAVALTNKTAFGPEGLRTIRSNPDGTPPTPDRILGHANTIDISAFAPTYTAELVIKLDTVAETQDIDLSTAVDKTAVTVAEVRDAINAAGFTDITASIDVTTGRVLIAYTGTETVGYMQVYDGSTVGFAAALDIGQGLAYGGFGCKFVRSFDNTKSIGLPKNIKDKEEIENESGDGTIITVIIAAKLKGLNPVLVMTDNDLELKQLIMGGTYVAATSTFTPPTTSQVGSPIFFMETFYPIYNKGTNKREDEAGYEMVTLPSCTGMEADLANEAKALGEYGFNISCTEYRDESDNLIASYIEQNLTGEEYAALDVLNV